MHWKKFAVPLVGIVLLIAAFVVVGNTIDDESIPEQRLLDEHLVVEDLEVNGEDEHLVVHEGDSVTVTATITNEGDEPIDVPLIIEWDDGVDDPHKGTMYEDLEPGETDDIEWTREEHGTWWPDEYTVIVGTESVTVAVVEELDITVEDLEVNGESEDVFVGLNESVTVTATVTNNEDGAVNVPLVIEWDDEVDVGHKGYVLEGLGSGETEDVEWTREEHGTWEVGEYTVSIGDEVIQVTVEEEPEPEEGLPGFTLGLLVIGSIIAVAIYQKKKK